MAESCEIWKPPIHPPQEFERNKFIFINRNKERALPKPTTVLINPHFIENRTVFVNPRFQRAASDITSQPKIYVNPNILKSVTSDAKTVAVNPKFHQKLNCGLMSSSEPQNLPKETFKIQVPENKNKGFDNQISNPFRKINANQCRSKLIHTKTQIVNNPQSIQTKNPFQMTFKHEDSKKPNQGENQRKVHTRLKIVNAPESGRTKIKSISQQKENVNVKDNSVCTRFKYIRNVNVCEKFKSVAAERLEVQKNHEESSNSKQASVSLKTPAKNSRTGFVNEHRKNALMTRFKYVRNGTKLIRIHKTPMKSKYKIVNNPPVDKQEKKDRSRLNSSIYRKKYVYLNKYNSSSFLANNVILKNSKQRYSMNINGILYQNSPCLLKKVASSKSKLTANSQFTLRQKGKVPTRQERPCKGKYRIVRSNSSFGKLKKNNVNCPIYRRTGKCKGLSNGTCAKVHNPDLIILCKSFLRGECQKENCLLSHKVSPEKMPTCKYFLEGLCNKTDCQYSHVKISPNAEICVKFLEGFCKDGEKCDKRHQFLCPEYERTKKCTKPKCIYPHGYSNTVRQKPVKRTSRKMIQTKIDKPPVQKVEDDVNQIRYYKDNVDGSNKNNEEIGVSTVARAEELAIPKREKLGSLPSFIPIS